MLLIGGGNGGSVVLPSVAGGSGGTINHALVYFDKGSEVNVAIGAGGLANNKSNIDTTGGTTTLGELSSQGALALVEAAGLDVPDIAGAALTYKGVTAYKPSAEGSAYGMAGGFGGGLTVNPAAVESEKVIANGVFFGGGGSAISVGASSWAGKGQQGAIRLRYHDPDKNPLAEIDAENSVTANSEA